MFISDVLRTKGREVITILQTESVSAAVRRLAERRIGALAVQDEWQKLVGIFSERDLVNALAQGGPAALDLLVRDLMSRPVITCRPEDHIDAILASMTANKVRHMPVIEGKELAGMISIGDLIKQRLEEKELESAVLLDISRVRA